MNQFLTKTSVLKNQEVLNKRRLLFLLTNVTIFVYKSMLYSFFSGEVKVDIK